jgi:hypothetical protein
LAHRSGKALKLSAVKEQDHKAKQRQPCGLFLLQQIKYERWKNYMKKSKRLLVVFGVTILLVSMFCVTAYAAPSGDVAGAIEGTWNSASQQIKTVVNKVVFPAIDLILAVFFFAKLGTAYFDYRKHGQFEWAAPAILFACLIFTLTSPLYIWQILGM